MHELELAPGQYAMLAIFDTGCAVSSGYGTPGLPGLDLKLSFLSKRFTLAAIQKALLDAGCNDVPGERRQSLQYMTGETRAMK